MAKTDKEFADDIEARERLRERGYKQIPCERCKGLGYSNLLFETCLSCGGKGYHWQVPLTKLDED